MPNPYGMPIGLADAKKVAAPAIAEAGKHNWTVAVAIVDPAGNLIYFEKMDNTQNAGPNIAIDKARSAAIFKRPTKALQDAMTSDPAGIRILRLQGAIPIDGGYPIIIDGKIIGAIGISGSTSENDAQCAKAGLAALK